MDIKSIVNKAKQGDQEAIGKLYEEFQKKGISLALKYVKTEENAEDMYQDSFIKAMSHLDTFDESKEFGPWINTIIVNTCKNFLEKKKAVNFSDMSDADEDLEFVESISNTDIDVMPEESFDRAEMVKIMDEIIGSLPEAQRQAVALFYYNEMSVKEISQLQDVSEDTIKSRLNYARKKVGTAIEEYQKKNGIRLYSVTLVPLSLYMYYKCGLASNAGKLAGMALGAKAVTAEKVVETTVYKEVGAAATKLSVKAVVNTVVKTGFKTVADVAVKTVAGKVLVGTTVAVIGVAGVTTATVKITEEIEKYQAIQEEARLSEEEASDSQNLDETLLAEGTEGSDGTELEAIEPEVAIDVHMDSRFYVELDEDEDSDEEEGETHEGIVLDARELEELEEPLELEPVKVILLEENLDDEEVPNPDLPSDAASSVEAYNAAHSAWEASKPKYEDYATAAYTAAYTGWSNSEPQLSDYGIQKIGDTYVYSSPTTDETIIWSLNDGYKEVSGSYYKELEDQEEAYFRLNKPGYTYLDGLKPPLYVERDYIHYKQTGDGEYKKLNDTKYSAYSTTVWRTATTGTEKWLYYETDGKFYFNADPIDKGLHFVYTDDATGENVAYDNLNFEGGHTYTVTQDTSYSNIPTAIQYDGKTYSSYTVSSREQLNNSLIVYIEGEKEPADLFVDELTVTGDMYLGYGEAHKIVDKETATEKYLQTSYTELTENGVTTAYKNASKADAVSQSENVVKDGDSYYEKASSTDVNTYNNDYQTWESSEPKVEDDPSYYDSEKYDQDSADWQANEPKL